MCFCFVRLGIFFFTCACVATSPGRCGEPLQPAVPAVETLNENPAQSDLGYSKIHSVYELIGIAELVLVAEIGDATVEGTKLRAIEVLRSPPKEVLGPAFVAEQQKRALALLDAEATHRERLKKDPKATRLAVPLIPIALPPLAVIPHEKIPLPRKGTQVLLVLWEREQGTQETPLRYRAAHPQCVYDVNVAPQVRLALERRRPEDNTRYLREMDAQLARKLELRTGDEALKKVPAGNVHAGLKLKALRMRSSVREDGTFDVMVRFQNLRSYDQAVYDGMLSGFGVRLRRKDDPLEKALLVRATYKGLTGDVDAATLAILDAEDFLSVPKADGEKPGELSKELHFSAADLPKLKSLDGAYVLNVFYENTKSGEGVHDLPAAPWLGTVVSDDIPALFGKGAATAVPKIPSKKP